jgi:FAD-dependent urate hydroxylase
VTHETDVAIVGSGPYGLSIGAQLRARSVEFRIFGPPMKFWRDMPAGINLKSFAFATNVYVPTKGHTFPDWCRANGLEDFEPCTMASFAAYGMSMKDRFVPNIETVEVKRVSLAGGGRFDIVLANDEQVRARRVVFATGLSYLKSIPPGVASLPAHLVTHTGDLTDYSAFRGKEVAVLGAGASAIEAGALVNEAGGRAQILVRENEAIFHGRMDPNRSLYQRLRKPISVIGPGMKNRIFQALPLAIHFIPERRRVRFVKGYLGPAAPWWIKDRVDGLVPIFVRTAVVAAEPVGQRVRLRLQVEGEADRTIEVDHVVAGTGYVPNLDRLEYLEDGLRRRLRRVELGPSLSMNFESSVPGAYFVGPVAALCFGPLFRFVCGAEYAAPAIARHLVGPVPRVRSALRRLGVSGSAPGRSPASSP